MSGNLLLEDRTWKTVLPQLGASALGTAALMVLLVPLLPLTGPARGALTALLAYAAFRLLYPLAARALPGGGMRMVPWEVTESALVLDGRRVARSAVRSVYVWSNRDSLGNRLPGWVVNIETEGKNLLLRLPDGGGEGGATERELRALVQALDVETRWAGE